MSLDNIGSGPARVGQGKLVRLALLRLSRPGDLPVRRLPLVASVCAGGVLCALLAACSAVPVPTSPVMTSPPPVVATDPPVPAPSDTGAPPGEVLTNVLTDSDGYRTRVEVSNLQVSTEHDVANQKPGLAQVSVYLSAEGKLTNLTRGHTLKGVGTVTVLPVWKAGSILCSPKIQRTAAASFETITVVGRNIWRNRADSFCALQGLRGDSFKLGSVEYQQTRPLPMAQYRVGFQDRNSPWGVSVPEDQLKRAEDAFKQPDSWFMLRSIDDDTASGVDGACKGGVGGLVVVVATTPQGSGLCARVITDRKTRG